MAANIYIYFKSNDDDEGPDRSDLEEELEVFFGNSAEDCGAGSGLGGFNLDFALTPGEEIDAWAGRLKKFLLHLGVDSQTYFDSFVDGWEPGMERRRVEIYGSDRRLSRDERR